MDPTDVPDVVVSRLPMYVRALSQLQLDGNRVVSSQELGTRLQMTPAQIRKDLSYFGRFGKQGRGYNVSSLATQLRMILGLDRDWRTCLVGVGRLGRAIISYPGFAPQGFKIVAVFDGDPSQIGNSIGNLRVRGMEDLAEAVQGQGIVIGIVAVPAEQAQSVIDQLVEAGIFGILNYAPTAPRIPDDVVMRNIDPVLTLQSMTYYLRQEQERRGMIPQRLRIC